MAKRKRPPWRVRNAFVGKIKKEAGARSYIDQRGIKDILNYRGELKKGLLTNLMKKRKKVFQLLYYILSFEWICAVHTITLNLIFDYVVECSSVVITVINSSDVHTYSIIKGKMYLSWFNLHTIFIV